MCDVTGFVTSEGRSFYKGMLLSHISKNLLAISCLFELGLWSEFSWLFMALMRDLVCNELTSKRG